MDIGTKKHTVVMVLDEPGEGGACHEYSIRRSVEQMEAELYLPENLDMCSFKDEYQFWQGGGLSKENILWHLEQHRRVLINNEITKKSF